MAKRWIDGPGIYNQNWDESTRDVFIWLFSVGADTCGMQKEVPGRIVADTGRSLRAVNAAVESLIADGAVIRYPTERGPHLALVHWQDNQAISYDGKHTCPPVPPEEFAKLSRATQERTAKMLTKQLAKNSQEPPAPYLLICSLPPLEDISGPAKRTRKADPGCGWCRKPTDVKDASKPEVARLVQHYHDRYRAEHGVCPSVARGKDFAAVKRKLDDGRPFPEVGAVIAHGLQSQDPYLQKRGFALADLMANYDGIALALRRKQPHGAATGKVTDRPAGRLRDSTEVYGKAEQR